MAIKKQTNPYIILAIFLLILLIGWLCPVLKIAQAEYGLSETGTAAGIGGSAEDIPAIIGYVAGAALAFSGSLFLFLIVYGGIMILTSAGNTDKVKKGKDIIIWAIIGALILGAAYAITTVMFSVFQQ